MYRHCGTNNRAPRWTFTDPCKPEVRPGAREESASPAWLAVKINRIIGKLLQNVYSKATTANDKHLSTVAPV